MAFADDLLKDAYHLAGRGGKNPRQSSLRRAVSTAYYAVFHLLIADFVANRALPDQRARLGRMFEHRRMSGAILSFRDKKNPTPTDVENTLASATEVFNAWRAIRKEKVAQHHLMSMFGARQN